MFGDMLWETFSWVNHCTYKQKPQKSNMLILIFLLKRLRYSYSMRLKIWTHKYYFRSSFSLNEFDTELKEENTFFLINLWILGMQIRGLRTFAIILTSHHKGVEYMQ
jgi:hypothetical protein